MGLLFTGGIQQSIMKVRKTSAIPDVSPDNDVFDERQSANPTRKYPNM
jgi:hypothetical protein